MLGAEFGHHRPVAGDQEPGRRDRLENPGEGLEEKADPFAEVEVADEKGRIGPFVDGGIWEGGNVGEVGDMDRPESLPLEGLMECPARRDQATLDRPRGRTHR